MMNLPPIEELSELAGNKYKLCGLVSKRAKQIQAKNTEMQINPEIKPISQAAQEMFEKKLTAE